MTKKILLIDDEEDLLEVIGARIKSWGYELLTASCASKAIEAVMNKAPDVIVLDYMLPDMDGIETLRHIRKINNKIPVIMFTAYPEKLIRGAEKLNISSLVPKLSAYSEFLPSLRTALDMIVKKLNSK